MSPAAQLLASELVDNWRPNSRTEPAVADVVVTLGASGCVAQAGGVSRRYAAHEVAAVDTTGASDAFMATFAAYLTAGASGPDAVEAAQAAAASVIQRADGHGSLPAPG
jgi:ribokinase